MTTRASVDIAAHGALTVRVVDRMMQFRVDRAKSLLDGHEAEKWDEARQATLREIGGDALVAAAAARDEQVITASVERAMAKFKEMTA